MKIQNPIIRGFCPDPSICKADGKYYIACSSFQFFPGVPIFESVNLINWKLIGHCLTRSSQVELHQVPSSGGVFAPTIRYNNGTFYMVTNNNSFNKNFYVFTSDIYGEWSEPIFVDQEGIDPSLLFDGEKVYFTSNGNDKEGNGCIYQCEIDITTGQKLTESLPIWGGSGGRYLESPHLYHIGDWYYLMVAEGGTEYGHMITYARAKEPFGPFEAYAGNPVLTNRNLGGNQNRIQGIGHGDLIEDEKGDFYLVCLGFRQNGEWSPYHHLGREVFLASVQWHTDSWFQAGNHGVVEEWMETRICSNDFVHDSYDADFEKIEDLCLRWCYLRDYVRENYEFSDKGLRLRGTEISLNEADTPTFIGLRQSEFETMLTVQVSGEAQEAGITLYMDEYQHYDLAIIQDNKEKKVILRLRIGDAESIVKSVLLKKEDVKIQLTMKSDEGNYYFFCNDDRCSYEMGSARTKYLSSEVAGGFTGVVMGLYAVDEKQRWAVFESLFWKQKAHKNYD